MLGGLQCFKGCLSTNRKYWKLTRIVPWHVPGSKMTPVQKTSILSFSQTVSIWTTTHRTVYLKYCSIMHRKNTSLKNFERTHSWNGHVPASVKLSIKPSSKKNKLFCDSSVLVEFSQVSSQVDHFTTNTTLQSMWVKAYPSLTMVWSCQQDVVFGVGQRLEKKKHTELKLFFPVFMTQRILHRVKTSWVSLACTS